MFKKLGRLATHHCQMVCAFWLIASIAFGYFTLSRSGEPGPDAVWSLPGWCDSTRGHKLLMTAFPAARSESVPATQASTDRLLPVAIALVFMTLIGVLFFQRSPALALTAILVAASAAIISLTLVNWLFRIPNIRPDETTSVLVLTFVFVVAVGSCLFLFRRYRNELANGHPTGKALRRTVASIGRPLAISAGSLACLLAMLIFAGYWPTRLAGLLLALSVVLAWLASLTLAPAILSLLGKRVLWPQNWTEAMGSLRWQDYWDNLCDFVIARPVVCFVTGLALMIFLAWLGLSTQANLLPKASVSQTAPGKTTVLLTSQTDWDSPLGRSVVNHLSLAFGYLANVAEVNSLTQPGDIVEHDAKAWYTTLWLPGQTKGASRAFVTRLEVIFRSPPFTPESLATQRVIDSCLKDELHRSVWPLTDVTAVRTGSTAQALDLAKVHRGDRLRVLVLTFVAAAGVLLVAVRRLWLMAFLLLVSLVAYHAALGGTALVSRLLYPQGTNGEYWRVFFVLFPALLTAGTDPCIRPLLRIARPGRSGLDPNEVWDLLNQSGGAILSNGLLTAGLFIALVFGGPKALTQLGIGLVFGTLLHTLIVRPFLTPAFLLLSGRLMEQENLPKEDSDVEDKRARKQIA